MEKRKIVLIGNHGSGKRIFAVRLFNDGDITSYTNKKMYIQKSSKYIVQNSSSEDYLTPHTSINEQSIIMEYDIDVNVILLDHIHKYDFCDVDAVLFFCDGSVESQIAI